MRKIDWVYIAGFFDGEGTISLFKTHGKSSYTKCNIRVTNTNKKVLDYIHKKLLSAGIESTVYLHYRDGYRGRRESHVLTFNKISSIIDFLKGMLPYLRIKHDQAKLVVEWAGKHISYHPRSIRGKWIKVHDQNYEDSIVQQVKAMK